MEHLEHVAFHDLPAPLVLSAAFAADADRTCKDAAPRAGRLAQPPQWRRGAAPAEPVAPAPSTENGNAAGLTRRELEVLSHLVAGRSYGEIAAALFISEKTVSVHVSHILAKLGLKDRTQLAVFAIRNHLADPD